MPDRLITLKGYFERKREDFLDLLDSLVALESPSGDKSRIDALADYYSSMIRPYVNILERLDSDNGATLKAGKGSGSPRFLLLAHMDTVWPVDAKNKPPHRKEGDIVHGPGVYDMKAGLAMALFVFKAIDELELELNRTITLLATPDEEIGSETSRPAIESAAGESNYVVVLEPPLADGSVKTRRKGVGTFRLEVIGKEAHAGVNPQDGINAIHELAMQISGISQYNDPDRGITVNIGMMGGGTADNVIPGSAWATIDFRAQTLDDAREIVAKLEELKPRLPGAQIRLSGGINRPPMEESQESAHLADIAIGIAAELGMKIGKGMTGGGSDGNFTAALGVPTIDGMGLDGAGAHTPDERIFSNAVANRCALLTEFLLRA